MNAKTQELCDSIKQCIKKSPAGCLKIPIDRKCHRPNVLGAPRNIQWGLQQHWIDENGLLRTLEIGIGDDLTDVPF